MFSPKEEDGSKVLPSSIKAALNVLLCPTEAVNALTVLYATVKESSSFNKGISTKTVFVPIPPNKWSIVASEEEIILSVGSSWPE